MVMLKKPFYLVCSHTHTSYDVIQTDQNIWMDNLVEAVLMNSGYDDKERSMVKQ